MTGLRPAGRPRTLIKKGAGWSRDSTAVTQGYRLAPHQSLLATSLSADNMVKALDTLEKATREAISHLQPAQNPVGPPKRARGH